MNYLVPNNEPSWPLLPLSLGGERHPPTPTWETTRVMLINCQGKDASHHVLWLSARLEVKVESTGCWAYSRACPKRPKLGASVNNSDLFCLVFWTPNPNLPLIELILGFWGLQPMLPCSFFPPKVSILISGGHYRLPSNCWVAPVLYAAWSGLGELTNFPQALQKV